MAVPLADVREAQEAALRETQDFLTSGALKQVADANKRELTARERSGMMEALAAAESLLRDVLLRLEGADEAIVNEDAAAVVDRLAARATHALGRARARRRGPAPPTTSPTTSHPSWPLRSCSFPSRRPLHAHRHSGEVYLRRARPVV